MRLHERLPDSVMVRGKRIKCDFDFRNVLLLLHTLERNDLTGDARIFLAVQCVIKRPKGNLLETLAALKSLLFPDKKQEETKPRITDFDQDADYIRAAFLQEYGINLWHDRLHWMEFIGLLGCLPEGNRYTEILGIRSRPMPAPTKWNASEREWLAKAKRIYALELSEKEQEQTLRDGLRNVALSLLTLAEKGGGTDGV